MCEAFLRNKGNSGAPLQVTLIVDDFRQQHLSNFLVNSLLAHFTEFKTLILPCPNPTAS